MDYNGKFAFKAGILPHNANKAQIQEPDHFQYLPNPPMGCPLHRPLKIDQSWYLSQSFLFYQSIKLCQ